MAGTRPRRLLAGAILSLALVACGGGAKSTAKPTTVAPASTLATTTTTAAPVSYTVKRGDTLGRIAKQFGVSLATLAAANHLTDQSKVNVGDILMVPVAGALAPGTGTTTVTGSGSTPGASVSVTPPDAAAGTTFRIALSGAKPSESVTFEIDAPGGAKFTGPAHTATAEGTVSASYLTKAQDPVGSYQVVAMGKQGSVARGSFHLGPKA